MSGVEGLIWEAAGTGHHSYLAIGRRTFLFARDGYDPELAALFREAERVYVHATEEDDDLDRYGYFALAWQLRQRLQVQGFTAGRALADLRKGIERWRDDQRNSDDEDRPAGSDHKSLPDVDELVEALRDLIATQPVFEDHVAASRVGEDVDELWRYVDTRSLLRVLLDAAPDETEVGLDLHELTSCCVEMDSNQPVAESARAIQLAAVSTNAPLIVLTEGSSDSRFLEMAMAATHPHLVGFVSSSTSPASTGPRAAWASCPGPFTPSSPQGVANRFVAIADNDTEGHAGLAKIKSE